jgi:hypothetical protein
VAAVYDSACERPLDALHVSAEAHDLLRLLPLPDSAARLGSGGDQTGRLQRACAANLDTGLPIVVVGDDPVGSRRLARRRAEVADAAATGLPVVAYHQRLRAGVTDQLARERQSLSLSG